MSAIYQYYIPVIVPGIELAIRARVPNDTNFQVFKFKFHMASLQKKVLVLNDFLLFQSFKLGNTDYASNTRDGASICRIQVTDT